jgi:hypothetical protein
VGRLVICLLETDHLESHFFIGECFRFSTRARICRVIRIDHRHGSFSLQGTDRLSGFEVISSLPVSIIRVRETKIIPCGDVRIQISFALRIGHVKVPMAA